jgi:hypothetical protein
MLEEPDLIIVVQFRLLVLSQGLQAQAFGPKTQKSIKGTGSKIFP